MKSQKKEDSDNGKQDRIVYYLVHRNLDQPMGWPLMEAVETAFMEAEIKRVWKALVDRGYKKLRIKVERHLEETHKQRGDPPVDWSKKPDKELVA